VWAVGLAIVFLTVGAVRLDAEAVAFGVATLVGVALTLLRKGLLGRIVLFLIAADTLLWMVPATIANLQDTEQFADVAVPAVLSVLALAVLLLVIGLRPAPVLAVGGLLLVGAIVLGVVASTSGEAIDADARVEAKNAEFSETELDVPDGGTVAVKNRDLFWHTFTVEELDIDVRIPTGATRAIEIEAEPGEYRFKCSIPGHESRMNGTLTVSG
jgi:plastocyanin